MGTVLQDVADFPCHLITFRLRATPFRFCCLLRGAAVRGTVLYSAPLFGLVAHPLYSACLFVLFLSFRVFSCLFGLLAFMCTVHVFSPTFCGLSRRWLRGSGLVRALVRRLLQSPLPCGVPSGLARPLFRGVGVGLRVFRWLAGVVFWPRLFWLCALGTRTLLRLARKKKVSY